MKNYRLDFRKENYRNIEYAFLIFKEDFNEETNHTSSSHACRHQPFR
jgi:hypothetical protein